MQIAETIGRLDATDAKKQKVYTYQLKNTDPESMAVVLRGVLGEQTQTQPSGTNRLNERSASGATMDTSEFSNGGGGGGGGRAGGR